MDVNGKRPGWSEESMALSLSNSIAVGLTRCLCEIGDLGGANGSSGRRGTEGLEVLLTPFEILLMCPIMDGTERGRCF